MKKVLVISPHPDDETLGCAGTLLAHKENGCDISWAIMTAMSDSEDSTKLDERKKEKQRGLEAKQMVKHILYGAKNIKLDSKGIGKYGRSLGVITIDGMDESLNDYLLNNGYAVKM